MKSPALTVFGSLSSAIVCSNWDGRADDDNPTEEKLGSGRIGELMKEEEEDVVEDELEELVEYGEDIGKFADVLELDETR